MTKKKGWYKEVILIKRDISLGMLPSNLEPPKSLKEEIINLYETKYNALNTNNRIHLDYV